MIQLDVYMKKWNSFLPYFKLLRVDHWVKNIFVLPGILFGLFLGDPNLNWVSIIIGIVSVCFASSANYVINEWLDRAFDLFHPTKKNRPSVVNSLNSKLVYLLYFFSLSISLALSLIVGIGFSLGIVTLLLMGLFYNVEPIRLKDRAYLDVLSESFNNPIRLVLGWVMVEAGGLPPSSLIISYWMSGAFLMGVKRYSELKFIENKTLAGNYRKSFLFYTPENLLGSILFYGICAGFFGGVFLVRYKLDLLLLFPFYSLLFTWYLMMGFKENSAAQHPEKLLKEKGLLTFSSMLLALTFLILYLDTQWVQYFLKLYDSI
jgi:decaprenyl-phosphate phosphoribosyltransferase